MSDDHPMSYCQKDASLIAAKDQRIAELEQEVERLKAELESKRLKWRKGDPDRSGFYFYRQLLDGHYRNPLMTWYVYDHAFFIDGIAAHRNKDTDEWAGPILLPGQP